MAQIKSGNKRSFEGFTLAELLIAVAIIGILSAMAYPSYKRNLMVGNRSNIQGLLVDCSQKFERQYSASMSYSSLTIANAGSSGTCVLTIPGVATSGGSLYNVSISTSASAYALIAVPAGSQANDTCKSVCIDSTGSKLAGVSSGSGTACSAMIASPLTGCW